MIYFVIAYGIIAMVGGLIGYFQAGSSVSLVSGLVSGVLIILSAVALLRGKLFGYYGMLVMTVILGIFFTIRFLNGFAFMPAGLMLVLSALALVGLLIKRPQLMAHTH